MRSLPSSLPNCTMSSASVTIASVRSFRNVFRALSENLTTPRISAAAVGTTTSATNRERTRQFLGSHRLAGRLAVVSVFSACSGASSLASAPLFVARVDTDLRNLSCHRLGHFRTHRPRGVGTGQAPSGPLGVPQCGVGGGMGGGPGNQKGGLVAAEPQSGRLWRRAALNREQRT